MIEERVNILGVGISTVSMREALDRSEQLLQEGGRGYICVTGVHGIIEAQRNHEFRTILNASYLCTPDGMPTVWLGHYHGHSSMTRVYGPDFMSLLCERSVAAGYRHFLYGGKPGVAEQLQAALELRYPGLQIVGHYTPPFRPLNASEEEDLRAQLTQAKVDVLWCGLSTPKQERFMARYTDVLPVSLMVGVGAAFDFLSGNAQDAPAWMKTSGLQWVHRLVQEPRRLAGRSFANNPRFLWLVSLQLLGLKRYSLTANERAGTAATAS